MIKNKTKTVILCLDSHYAKRKIYVDWSDIKLPLRHIAEYIPGTKSEDSDEMICFLPTGRYGKTKSGEKLEIWRPKAEQASLI